MGYCSASVVAAIGEDELSRVHAIAPPRAPAAVGPPSPAGGPVGVPLSAPAQGLALLLFQVAVGHPAR